MFDKRKILLIASGFYFVFILIYILACECDTGIYDTGYLVRTERLRTQDIPQMVKTKNYWQVHFNCCKVHAWLIFVLLKSLIKSVVNKFVLIRASNDCIAN